MTSDLPIEMSVYPWMCFSSSRYSTGGDFIKIKA